MTDRVDSFKQGSLYEIVLHSDVGLDKSGASTVPWYVRGEQKEDSPPTRLAGYFVETHVGNGCHFSYESPCGRQGGFAVELDAIDYARFLSEE